MSETFKKALQVSGMVDTRRNSLAYNMSQLHNSISQMDGHHLTILLRDYPEILEAARVYAKHEVGLNRFEQAG